DVAFDPGGTTTPRIAALHMLRSAVKTVSAPAISSFRGSIPHPTHALCTLRVRRCRRLTQHSLPGGPLWPYRVGLAPTDRASFAWRLPSLDHLVGAAGYGLCVRVRRQAHCKDRAFTQLARHGHVAAHHARELAGDGEAKPRAAEALRGRGIGLGEFLEQLDLLFRRHADA